MRERPMARSPMSAAEEQLSLGVQNDQETPEPFGAEIFYQEQRLPVEVQRD